MIMRMGTPPPIPNSSSHPAVSPRARLWGCSPSCRYPDGRYLLARSGGCSRARSPHGCHCRRSRASTPASRTRKSTEHGGRRRRCRPGEPGRMVKRAVKRATRLAACPGTPASWCRAQGRARAASDAGLRRGHGRTDGRVHLARHRLHDSAEWPLLRRPLNPPAGRPRPQPPAAAGIGAEQAPF